MKLENKRYEVTFTTAGGEIASFTDKETGIQYMWQGDETYWSGSNPSLFPMIGNTYDKTYTMDGTTYAMKNHGLIRYATLHALPSEEGQVVMGLDSDATTMAEYPFPFHYEVAYTLEDNKLTITYHITNTGEKEMPFTFGLHPGFNCPLCAKESFADYKLIFSNEEHVQQLIFDEAKAKPYELRDVHIKEIPCDYELIDRYATLIYKSARSAYLTLQGPSNHGVRISIAGYPYLAIWTAREGAPFICLEPWYGHGDFSKLDVPFEEREGTMRLSSKQTFTTSYTIEVF